jgi:hypothetical protein
MALYPGSFTLGESDKVLFVGPMAPATNAAVRPLASGEAKNSATASLAIGKYIALEAEKKFGLK